MPIVAVLVVAIVLCSVFVPNLIKGKASSGTGSNSNDSYLGMKIGLICLHDENSTYDAAFINAIWNMKKDFGFNDSEIIIMTGIDETRACVTAAEELINQGCNVIIGDSYGYDSFLTEVATAHQSVEIFNYSGDMAAVSNCVNFHNFYVPYYQNEYLAGTLAGLKLIELYGDIDGKVSDANAKIGYVGAFQYAECVSRYTAFYLGAKSICSNVTMEVQFVNSWYDELAESDAALNLIDRGAKIISQYSDSNGPVYACSPNIPCITSSPYNSNVVIARTVFDPTNLLEHIISSLKSGVPLENDIMALYKMRCLSIETKEELPAGLENSMISGQIKVFDTSTFTVNGNHISSYLADVIRDENWQADTQVIQDGEFLESYYRSAPYFDIKIDGITLINGWS